jgi:ABC-type multidrug transport system ATPase subunit
MTALPPTLEVRSVGVRAGARWIIEGVSFEARKGEVTAVIGPNGAGKTTLLEAIVGLRTLHGGSVRFEGASLGRFRDFARSFAFLPDAGVLPPEAIVRTPVEHATARSSDRAALQRLREGLTIETLIAKPVGVLSRGEHQRVALYCTLALGRPVTVLDEPFSAFDPLQLRSVLAAVRDVAGTSTAIVTSIHQLVDAERIADRILLLADGRALVFGTPAALRERVGRPDASLEEVFVSLLEESRRAS